MDLSQHPVRSENVEDLRTGKVKEMLNLLTAPMQASYHDLVNHPFEKPDDFYERLYLTNNPVVDPATYGQLGKDLGVGGDVDRVVKALRGQ